MRPVLALCVSVLMLALCNATAARSPLSEVQKGTITIQHQTRVDDSLKMTLAALGQPLAVDSPSTAAAAGAGPMASVAPAVTANMKRIYFKNNCTCQGGVQSSKAPYPVVALSYKPVQSADFYNIGFWSVTGCDAKYLVATTEGILLLNWLTSCLMIGQFQSSCSRAPCNLSSWFTVQHCN